MAKEILTFGDTETEKNKFYRHQKKRWKRVQILYWLLV